MRILAGANQSSQALTRRLRQRGYSTAAIETAVDRCRALGYVDDGALAQSLADRLQRTGHGRARVAAELRARGIERGAADSALDALGSDEEPAMEVGRRLLERELLRGDDDGNIRRRVAAALQRRGFSGSTIAATLRGLSQEAGAR